MVRGSRDVGLLGRKDREGVGEVHVIAVADPGKDRMIDDVFQRGPVGKQVEVLKDESNLLPQLADCPGLMRKRTLTIDARLLFSRMAKWTPRLVRFPHLFQLCASSCFLQSRLLLPVRSSNNSLLGAPRPFVPDPVRRCA